MVRIRACHADAQVVAKRAQRELEACGRRKDVEVAHVRHQALVQANRADVGDGRRGGAGDDAVGNFKHQVLHEQRDKAQGGVLLQRNRRVHAALEHLGIAARLQLLLHAMGDVAHRLVGLAVLGGSIRDECQAEEVHRGDRLEERPQVNRHIHADGALALALGHLIAQSRNEHRAHERRHAHAPAAGKSEHVAHREVQFHERGIALVVSTRQAPCARGSLHALLVTLEVFVKAVLSLLAVRSVVVNRRVAQIVAFAQVEAQKRTEELQRAAPVAHHVGDFDVDTRAEVCHAEQHAVGVHVQAVAHGQRLGERLRHLSGRLEVVPKHAATQAHVEVRKHLDRLNEGVLQHLGVDVVHESGRVAEHGLARTARLRRVELAYVI